MILHEINFDEAALAELCRRRHVRRLSLFGSILSDEFGPDSDIDMLVEFEPGARVGLIGMGVLHGELSDFLGREVDLRTPNELSQYIRQDVLDRAKLLHAA
jgi:uncharacterized protein